MTDHSSERVRAEAKYRKLQRASEGASAVAQYEAEGEALRQKTSRLRALRLAQETVVNQNPAGNGSHSAARLDPPAQGEHVYRLGEILRFTAQVRTMAADGDYEVVGLLPPRGDEPQYRIKNVREGHERVALQDQLSRT